MPCEPANGLLPGRGAPGRDMPCALAKGLLPGRGPPAGRAASSDPSSARRTAAAGAGASAGALGAAASAGAGRREPRPRGRGRCRRGARASRRPASTPAGAFGFSGALMPSASSAAFSRRATGGAMLEEALLTNSPMSLSLSSAILLSMPRSAATSCTRGLATILLSGVHPVQEWTITARGSSFRAAHELSMVRSTFRSNGVEVRGSRSCDPERPPEGPAPDRVLDASRVRMHPRAPAWKSCRGIHHSPSVARDDPQRVRSGERAAGNPGRF